MNEWNWRKTSTRRNKTKERQTTTLSFPSNPTTASEAANKFFQEWFFRIFFYFAFPRNRSCRYSVNTKQPNFSKSWPKLVATFLVCSWRPKTLGITWVVVVVLVTKKWDFQIAQKVPWYLGYQKISCRGGSPGLVVLGGDSASKGRGFESLTHKQDGHFSHLFVVKIVMFVWKDEKKWKEAGMAHLEKKSVTYRYLSASKWIRHFSRQKNANSA